MPHSRKRHIISILSKKLRFSPVVAIQGARQTGKSFLAQHLLKEEEPKSIYRTFDRSVERRQAVKSPDRYVQQVTPDRLFIIDEAQKVPEIFDSIKAEVDENRQPGRFLLLGSTAFSKLDRIRESLTGRMSRVRLYPFNLAECHALPENKSNHLSLVQSVPRISSRDFFSHLKKGGLPAVFAIRSDEERANTYEDWLGLVLERDLMQFPRFHPDADLAREILQKIALLEEPNISEIARAVREDPRRVKTHLELLSHLFAVHELKPHSSGTGKSLYFMLDVGLTTYLGSELPRQLETWLLQEQLSKRSYLGDRQSVLRYYRNSKGSRISLIIENEAKKELCALKLLWDEKWNRRDLNILEAFREKNPHATLMALGPNRSSLRKEKIEIFPWESLA